MVKQQLLYISKVCIFEALQNEQHRLILYMWMCEIDAHLSHIIVIAQFGLERQLYSTAEGDEDLEICVELLQGNITQRTFIGIRSGFQSAQCKYHFHIKYLLSHKD